MIAAFSFHSDQHCDQASTATDVMMNISNNGNGSLITGGRHHHRSLYQNQHEFVNQDMKEGLGLNVTSPPEPSPIALTGHLYHYPPPYRQVKRRRRLTEEETNVLNNIFENVQKPDAITRAQLAQKLNMSSRAIQVWFQNRRAKVKRDALESKNAAKNNKPKKLTLVADYCPEKMNQLLPSSPPSSTSTLSNNSLNHSSPKYSLSDSCTNLPRTSGIMPNLANISIALTSNLCTSPKEQKLAIPNENPINSYVSRFIHLNRNENGENDIMSGLIQHEKIGHNVDYWNASYLKSEEIDGQSAYDSLYDQGYYHINEQRIATPLNNNNTQTINNNQTSTWFLSTPPKIISQHNNIFESNAQQYDYLNSTLHISQNDRHLPLFITPNYMFKASINEGMDAGSTTKQSSSAVLPFKQLPQRNSQDSCHESQSINDDNESITTGGETLFPTFFKNDVEIEEFKSLYQQEEQR